MESRTWMVRRAIREIPGAARGGYARLVLGLLAMAIWTVGCRGPGLAAHAQPGGAPPAGGPWTLDVLAQSLVSSCVAMYGDLVYCSVSRTGPHAGWGVLAIDAGPGRVIGAAYNDSVAQAWSRIVRQDGTIAFLDRSGTVYAFDEAASGVTWVFKAGGDLRLSYNSRLTAGGGFIFICGGGQANDTVFALAASTGRVAWEAQPGAQLSDAGAFAAGRLVVADVNGRVYGLTPENGAVAWTVQATGARISLLAAADSVAWYDRDGPFGCIDGGNGSLRWQRSNGPGLTSWVCAADDQRFYWVPQDQTEVEAFDLSTGSAVWMWKGEGVALTRPSVVAFGGRVVCFEGRDRAYIGRLVALDGGTGQVVGSLRLPRPGMLPPPIYAVAAAERGVCMSLQASQKEGLFSGLLFIPWSQLLTSGGGAPGA